MGDLQGSRESLGGEEAGVVGVVGRDDLPGEGRHHHRGRAESGLVTGGGDVAAGDGDLLVGEAQGGLGLGRGKGGEEVHVALKLHPLLVILGHLLRVRGNNMGQNLGHHDGDLVIGRKGLLEGNNGKGVLPIER